MGLVEDSANLEKMIALHRGTVGAQYADILLERKLISQSEWMPVCSLAQTMVESIIEADEDVDPAKLPYPEDVLEEYRDGLEDLEKEVQAAEEKMRRRRRAKHVHPATSETETLVKQSMEQRGIRWGDPHAQYELLTSLAHRLGKKLLPPRQSGPKKTIHKKLDQIVLHCDVARAREFLSKSAKGKITAGAIATLLLKEPRYQKEFGNEGGHDRLRKRIGALPDWNNS